MTVAEAIRQIQKKNASITNRASVNYAQEQIENGEKIGTAVTANIFTPRGHYPGVVVLTDRRVLAVCGMPGIKRLQSFALKDLLRCEEAESPLTYRATFRTRDDSFSITLPPTIGKEFSRYVAKINAAFDSIHLTVDGNIRHGATLKQEMRRQSAEIRELIEEEGTDLAAISAQLDQWLTDARAQGEVPATDPLAVAARLAHELQETSPQSQEV